MVVALLVGLIGGLTATSLVIADTIRRELPARTRGGWIGFVALVSIGGSVGVAVGDTTVFRLIAAGSDPVIAVTPLALLTGIVLTSGFLCALAVLAYGIGSRYGPFKSTAERGRQPGSKHENAN